MLFQNYAWKDRTEQNRGRKKSRIKVGVELRTCGRLQTGTGGKVNNMNGRGREQRDEKRERLAAEE